MARPLRIEYAGAFYHVMNRGICRREFFYAEEFAGLFYDLFEEVHERYQIEFHSFCLMGNHFHILIRTVHPNLSKAMQHLSSVFTRRYNKLVNGDGPLFKGRFKSILVDKENYFLELSRYIPLNPVKPGIVKNPKDYQWSSYRYFFNEHASLKPKWLYLQETLAYFSSKNPIYDYEQFVLAGMDLDFDKIFKFSRKTRILGSDSFIKQIKDNLYLKNSINSVQEISGFSAVINYSSISIEFILDVIVKHYGINLGSILTLSPINKHPRQIAIYLAVKLSKKGQKAVARYFNNISYSWVSKTYRHVESRIKIDDALRNETDELQRQILIMD